MQSNDTPNNNLIPYGYCHCGCGEKTKLHTSNWKAGGHVKGEPRRFVRGHGTGPKGPRKVSKDRLPRWSESDQCYVVPLTHGSFAKIDTEDVKAVSQHTWHRRADGYAVSSPKGGSIYMHRVILNAGGGEVADHINGDRLDNRRQNLRIVTPRENVLNRSKLRSDNTSGYHGVARDFYSDGWRAHITVHGKHKSLGIYKTPEQAAKVRDEAAIKHFGSFATLNFDD